MTNRMPLQHNCRSTGGSEMVMELINMKINATMSLDQRQLMEFEVGGTEDSEATWPH